MFVDTGWKRPEEPPVPRPRLTPRQESVFLWIVVLNALLMLLAPIGGATIVQAIAALLRG